VKLKRTYLTSQKNKKRRIESKVGNVELRCSKGLIMCLDSTSMLLNSRYDESPAVKTKEEKSQNKKITKEAKEERPICLAGSALFPAWQEADAQGFSLFLSRDEQKRERRPKEAVKERAEEKEKGKRKQSTLFQVWQEEDPQREMRAAVATLRRPKYDDEEETREEEAREENKKRKKTRVSSEGGPFCPAGSALFPTWQEEDPQDNSAMLRKRRAASFSEAGVSRLLAGVMCGTVYGMVVSNLYQDRLLFLSCEEQKKERRPKEVVKERAEPLYSHLGYETSFRLIRVPRSSKNAYAAFNIGLTQGQNKGQKRRIAVLFPAQQEADPEEEREKKGQIGENNSQEKPREERQPIRLVRSALFQARHVEDPQQEMRAAVAALRRPKYEEEKPERGSSENKEARDENKKKKTCVSSEGEGTELSPFIRLRGYDRAGHDRLPHAEKIGQKAR